MSGIQEKLQTLVRDLTTYDEQKQKYIGELNDVDRLRLDARLNQTLNELLLTDGPATEKISSNYRKLTQNFHPDKKIAWLAEVVWIESQLSKGPEDAFCFKTLIFCFEKLTKPEQYKNTTFASVNKKEDLKELLKRLQNNSNTYTGRYFFRSLGHLLEEQGAYFDEVGRLKPTGIKILLRLLPFFFTGYGVLFVGEELLVGYSVFFVLLKGGQSLEHSDSDELKSLGSSLYEIGWVSATAVSTMVVRLTEVIFWSSRKSYALSLKAGALLLAPLSSSASRDSSNFYPSSSASSTYSTTASTGNELVLRNQFLDDLKLAGTVTAKGTEYKNMELHYIAAPLAAYLNINSQQFFKSIRPGLKKGNLVESFLLSLQILDLSDDPIEAKIKKAWTSLDHLKANKEVYVRGSKAAEAIDNAQGVIVLLNEALKALQLSR